MKNDLRIVFIAKNKETARLVHLRIKAFNGKHINQARVEHK